MVDRGSTWIPRLLLMMSEEVHNTYTDLDCTYPIKIIIISKFSELTKISTVSKELACLDKLCCGGRGANKDRLGKEHASVQR